MIISAEITEYVKSKFFPSHDRDFLGWASGNPWFFGQESHANVKYDMFAPILRDSVSVKYKQSVAFWVEIHGKYVFYIKKSHWRVWEVSFFTEFVTIFDIWMITRSPSDDSRIPWFRKNSYGFCDFFLTKNPISVTAQWPKTRIRDVLGWASRKVCFFDSKKHGICEDFFGKMKKKKKMSKFGLKMIKSQCFNPNLG